MNTVAIIQARLGSTRLPGKVLLPLDGRPALEIMLDRVKRAETVNKIVVATTSVKQDDIIAGFCAPFDSVGVFRGSEEDVLTRIADAAAWADADIIVDLTADCPLVDPEHIDYLIKLREDNGADYAANDVIARSWPDGLDVQVYTRAALERLLTMEREQPGLFSDRWLAHQHSGWNIGVRPELFRTLQWPAPLEMRWPELGLTLDEVDDWWLLNKLVRRLGGDARAEEYVACLRQHPDWICNAGVRRKVPGVEA